MPPAPVGRPPTLTCWLVLAGLTVAVGAFLYSTWPIGPIVIGLIGGCSAVLARTWIRDLAAQAAERRQAGESLCTFARAFPRRDVDTWVIRAVWDALQPYLRRRTDAPFPIRATDRPCTDFGIHVEDLEDLADELLVWTGRSWDGADQDPLYSKEETVDDLVRFVDAQPLREAGVR